MSDGIVTKGFVLALGLVYGVGLAGVLEGPPVLRTIMTCVLGGFAFPAVAMLIDYARDR